MGFHNVKHFVVLVAWQRQTNGYTHKMDYYEKEKKTKLNMWGRIFFLYVCRTFYRSKVLCI